MSGKFLHGLVINEINNIIVVDNIFSHSELRQYVSDGQTEQKIAGVGEWSYDYVHRCFVETKEDVVRKAKKWINENLADKYQLRAWIDRNWEGIVNGDETERKIYIWELLDNPKIEDDKINNFLKADVDWQKAHVDWQKADADWQKANVDWQKADADWQKAYVDWQKANVDWQKAYVDWQKAYADRQKAYVDWQKANVDWQKADADRQKAYVDWQKADADWQTRIMKPVFFKLFDKFLIKVWQS